MNCKIKSNDFCQDNCPFADLQKVGIKLENGEYLVEYLCTHTEICKYVYDMGFAKGVEVAYDEIADKFVTSIESEEK